MSKFKCYFENERFNKTFEFKVSLEGTGEQAKIVIKHDKNVNVNENKIVVAKFDLGKPEPIMSYFHLLIRQHLERKFCNDLGSFCVKHEGGKISIYNAPKFKYMDKMYSIHRKKHDLMTTLKEVDTNSGEFFRDVNKLTKLDIKLKKVEAKHEQELDEMRQPYITKTINELSEILEDMLILVQDTHEITVI